MRRIILLAVVTFALVAATGATASGPAPPGKDTLQLNCEGFAAPVTVSVPGSQSNNGAGQIVDSKGHGIGVSFLVSLYDVTKSTPVFSDSSNVGGGNAHPNQPTTNCSGVVFQGPASAFFGTQPLPPGVAATDIVRLTLSADVIIKL